MQVVLSRSSFAEVLRDLRGCGSIAVPVSVYPSFVAYCNSRGYYPASGSVVGSPTGDLRYLYLPL